MRTLADVDCAPVVTVAAEAPLAAALDVLLAARAAEVYVVDADRRLLGIVPDYELLKARLNGTWTDQTVEQVMSRQVLSFTADTPVDAVLKAFREGQHSRAAITDHGRLIGQITRTDLLRAYCLQDRTAKPVAAPKFLHAAPSARVLVEK